MNDTVAKSTVEALIIAYALVDTVKRNFHGFDVFILENGITIRLPVGNLRMPLGEVVHIAMIKLELDSWEFDYWAGQNGIS